MLAYVASRLAVLPVVLLAISVVAFLLVRQVPGDVVTRLIGKQGSITKEEAEQLRTELGLNRPVVVQYGEWLRGAVRGDLGTSMVSRRPVADLLRKHAPVTVELALLSVLFSTTAGITLGTLSAVKQGRWPDYVARAVALAGLSVPTFIVGTVALMALAIWVEWSPPLPYASLTDDPLKNLRQMYLPVLVLGFSLTASLARMTRSSVLEVLRQDYVRTARSKGLQERVVIFRHAVRNALLPVLTISSLQVAYLLGGAVIVELIFTLPGLGRLMLDSVLGRDYTVIMGLTMLAATVFVVVNILTDIAYRWLDPRLAN